MRYDRLFAIVTFLICAAFTLLCVLVWDRMGWFGILPGYITSRTVSGMIKDAVVIYEREFQE